MAVQKNTKKNNSFKYIMIALLVLVLLMMITTVVTYFVASTFMGKNGNMNSNIDKGHITYDAGEFLTNLSDKGYIKISLVYLINNKQVEEELQLKDSEIRDKIFSILRARTNQSVRDSKGMENLREEIKKSLNQILGSESVIDVYFTSIIVN